jgi:hypothetical protein
MIDARNSADHRLRAIDGMEAINSTFSIVIYGALCTAYSDTGIFFMEGSLTLSAALARLNPVTCSDFPWNFVTMSFTRHCTPTRGFFNSLSPPSLLRRTERF